MFWRCFKITAIGLVCLALVGGFVFGKDLISYVRSTAKGLRAAVRDAVPLEFELARAKDLLEGIIPEMQANVRVIATEEVEVASLERDIHRGQEAIAQERKGLGQLAEAMNIQQASYSFGDRQYSRQQVKEDLARRFDRFKEAENVLDSKKRLLNSRQGSLQAAVRLLEQTRSQKALLEEKVAMLEGQYRLVQAASAGSRFQVDHSRLAQTEKLLGEIKKRLDVAERVLAHEATFVPEIEVDVVSEKELVAEVAKHLGTPSGEGQAPGKGLASAGGEATPLP
jgi:hypothetical protein